MNPYYEEDGIMLYHADCRDMIDQIGPINSIITDPPYGIGKDYGTEYKDRKAGYREFLWPIIESYEAKIETGCVGLFQAVKNARFYAEWFPRQWRLISVAKVWGQWNRNLHIQYRLDFLLYWLVNRGSSERHETVNTPRDWLVSRQVAMTSGPRKRPDHPYPSPIDAMRYLVDVLVAPGWLILDPFAGAGSTLLAAKQMRRPAIGIEVEERFCEVAAQRLTKEMAL